MASGGSAWWWALGVLLFAQGGLDPRGDTRVAGPPGAGSPGPAVATASPAAGGGGGGGGGGSGGDVRPDDIRYPDLGPMVLPIDGGNRRGVDAVGVSPVPAGGGGGGGGMRTDPEPPVQLGPWFLRFEPPADHRGDAGPGGAPEPTLAPGSPPPRR